jgi:hypothetical protein
VFVAHMFLLLILIYRTYTQRNITNQ